MKKYLSILAVLATVSVFQSLNAAADVANGIDDEFVYAYYNEYYDTDKVAVPEFVSEVEGGLVYEPVDAYFTEYYGIQEVSAVSVVVATVPTETVSEVEGGLISGPTDGYFAKYYGTLN